MVNPLPGYGITTAFKQRGKYWSTDKTGDPLRNQRRGNDGRPGWGIHTGSDFSGPGCAGKTIVAATPGRVIAANAFDQAYGYKVIIRWGGYDVWYCHMPAGKAKVKVGQTIAAGTPIGVVGQTGNVSGPHLHLELRIAGGGFALANFRDPMIAVNYAATRAPTTKVGKATSPSITHRVTATQLNGRGGPGTDYKIKGHPAPKGKTVVEVRRSGNWVMTATKRWFSLAYLEQVKVAPKPATVPGTVKISSETINLAGAAVNTHGVKTAAKRLSRYTAHLAGHKVTSVLTQEVNTAILGHLNAMLPMQDAKGGNGRFVTVSNSAKVIASGVFTAPDRYNGDDKQCAWIVYEAGGALSCEGSMHLEYRDGAKADAVRVKQATYFAEQLLAKAKAHNVPLGNVMLAGDTNSEGLVLKELLGQKWRNAAAGTDFEDDRTFTGWDNVARKRFDYVLVYDGPGATPVKAEVTEVVPDVEISDHARLRVVRHLIKNPTK